MLPLTLIFICRHDYSFGSDKKWVFNERFFLLLGKINNCSARFFPKQFFLIKPFLVNTFKPQEVLNK